MSVKQEDKKYCDPQLSPPHPLYLYLYLLSPLASSRARVERDESGSPVKGGGEMVRGDDESLAELLPLLALEGAKARKLLVALALVELAGEVEAGQDMPTAWLHA